MSGDTLSETKDWYNNNGLFKKRCGFRTFDGSIKNK